MLLKPPPIHRLPPELLSEIFHWYLTDSTFYNVAVVRDGPWLLSHICRQWREIAISLNSLWSSFFIASPLPSIKDPEALLQTVLKRSEGSPLSFGMWLERDISLLEMPMKGIITELAAHSTAWKDVKFGMSSYNHFNEVVGLFSDLTVQPSLLETLHINISSLDAHEPDQHPITIFADAPMLRSVSIRPFFPMCLPWSQMTYLCTTDLSLEQLLHICRVAVHLETFLMECVHIDPQGDTPIPVTNNAIKTLQTWDFEFLPYLTLPSLTSLHIDESSEMDEVSLLGVNEAAVRGWDKVSRFVGRSGCRLKSLRITIDMASDDLLTMLRTAMTDVTDITFVNETGSTSQSSLLLALQKDPHILPKLERLYFSGSNSRDHCDLKEVLEFVQSRYGNGMGSLKSLHIDCERLFPEEDELLFGDEDRRFYLDQLKVFIDDGLDLVIDLDEELIEI
ncbi:uncharacterized protein EV420DRAFT_9041 [Desarmillaria tabescens]|uniref:F-box domain-containing protein n=1 Tax=Armillaria tabescens TaxID=1929756 RepID=A0AA39NNX3_ARMTA|nr:uncharacterized protein EV420DRAFT_9041 [Desarmillaria tabescens]KAK0469113.1 hypothetical protein EV420DRAFT_9041 [Desarmillaria tabescens]